MKNNLLVKTILSCLLGAVLWAGITYISCLINDKSFVDKFFSPGHIIEVVVVMTVAGIVYYIEEKKKIKNNK